ncbi:MAG: hypothetical protein ACOX63_13505 [Christensenellales bacterium]|jgi:hypothetical protein
MHIPPFTTIDEEGLDHIGCAYFIFSGVQDLQITAAATIRDAAAAQAEAKRLFYVSIAL